MAVLPRHIQLLDDATAMIERLTGLECQADGLISLGTTRPIWAQEYVDASLDAQLKTGISDTIRAIRQQSVQLVAVETTVLQERLAARPASIPRQLRDAQAQLTNMQQLAHPGNAQQLKSIALKSWCFEDADKQRLDTSLTALARVERRSVDSWADSEADARSAKFSDRWILTRQRAEATYITIWGRVRKFLLDQLLTVETRLSSLAHTHALGLLKVPEPTLEMAYHRLAATILATVNTSTHYESVLSHALTRERTAQHRFRTLLQSLHSLEATTRRSAERMDSRDHELALRWVPRGPNPDYWSNAMLSARHAELVLQRVYASLFGSAMDLSIAQLTRPTSGDWRFADIEAGGRWIDVKNARTSFSSPLSYVEHCVPRFKQDRVSGDVVVSGVLSPYNYKWNESAGATDFSRFVDFAGDEPAAARPFVWLGEVTPTRLMQLAEAFTSDHLDASLRIDHRGVLLPSWVFEYPDEFYAPRDLHLCEVAGSSFRLPRGALWPGFGVVTGRMGRNHDFDPIQEEAYLLQSRVQELGLSRPVLYLHILDRFCRAMAEGSRFFGDAINAVLHCEQHASTPLCLVDPLGAIAELLATLSSASPAIAGTGFRKFFLKAPGILRALGKNGELYSVIAYCAGWREVNGNPVPCGRNPIFLGPERHCSVCPYLVCSICGFCKSGCPGLRQRGYPFLDWHTDSPTGGGWPG